MEGDLTQIKAKNYSGLDKYLSISDANIKDNRGRQTSLFEPNFDTYKKPTNFSVNTRKVQSNNKFDFGQKVKFTIPRYGDKICEMYLEIELPTLSNVGYVNTIGYSLIEYIEVEIGGKTIDKHYDTWMDIHDKLMIKADHREGINEMVLRFDSHTDSSFRGGTVIVPLKFWFTEGLSQSFPLTSLSHQDIIIYVKLRPFKNVWMSNSGVSPVGTYEITSGYLLVDYIRLDSLERKMMYNKKYKYLIKQIQLIDTSTLENATSAKISLESINYPVSELIWIIRSDTRETEKDWFNYLDTTTSTIDPMQSAYITFDEKDRLEEHTSKFYRMIQPYKKHSNIPNDYIYMYSFATKPEYDAQPTGSCNFSELNDVSLHLKLKTNLSKSKIYVYAVNYNVLLVEDGYAWLEKCLSI
jgi:hypothetical protein